MRALINPSMRKTKKHQLIVRVFNLQQNKSIGSIDNSHFSMDDAQCSRKTNEQLNLTNTEASYKLSNFEKKCNSSVDLSEDDISIGGVNLSDNPCIVIPYNYCVD